MTQHPARHNISPQYDQHVESGTKPPSTITSSHKGELPIGVTMDRRGSMVRSVNGSTRSRSLSRANRQHQATVNLAMVQLLDTQHLTIVRQSFASFDPDLL